MQKYCGKDLEMKKFDQNRIVKIITALIKMKIGERFKVIMRRKLDNYMS